MNKKYKTTGIKAFLRVLFTPSCWLQNHYYSASWDAELRRLMETEQFKPDGEYCAYLGSRLIWVANHPYCSMQPYPHPKVHPRRATVLYAYDKYLDEVLRVNVPDKSKEL